MKNWMRIAALALCMLFVFPAALAQQTTYMVGQPTTDAFTDAFASGKLVTAQLSLDLDLNAQTLGVSDEEAQIIEILLDVLRQANVTVGAGLLDQGLRIAAEAELVNSEGGNPVSVDVLADVTPDGIAVESGLIPGKRVTAGWAKLLAMTGYVSLYDAQDIVAQIKNTDIEALVEQMLPQIMAIAEQAAAYAAPYAETIVNHIMTLPIEVRENLAEEDYPPTALEVSVTVTLGDIAELAGKLGTQLQADTELCDVLDALSEQMELDYDSRDLINGLMRFSGTYSKDGRTNVEVPITLYLGMNEEGVPLYVEAYAKQDESGESIYAGLFLYQDEQGMWTMEAILGAYDEEGKAYGSAYLGGNYMSDPADANVYAGAMEMRYTEEDATLMEMAMTIGSEKTAGDLPAYDTSISMNMFINDGYDRVQAVVGAQGHQELTAAGGEATEAATTTDVYMDGVSVTQTETVEQVVEPTADGGVTGYTKVSQTMPASGVDKMDVTIRYASEEIDEAASQALAQIALDTASQDDLNALMMNAITVLSEEKLPAAMENLPTEVVQLIEASMQ